MATKILGALTGSLEGGHSSEDQSEPNIDKVNTEQTKEEERQARARASLERLGLAGQLAVKASKKVDSSVDKDQQVGQGPIRLSTNDNQVQKTQVTLLSKIWSVLSRISSQLSDQLESQEEESIKSREHDLEKHRIETQSPAGNLHDDSNSSGSLLGGVAALLAPLALEIAPVVAGLGAMAAVLSKFGGGLLAPTPKTSATGDGSDDSMSDRASRSWNNITEHPGRVLTNMLGITSGFDDDKPKAVGGTTPTGQTVDNSKQQLVTPGLTMREQAFVDSISKYESGKGDPHEAVFGYGKYGSPNKRLTDMTVEEVEQFQQKLRQNTKAAGIGKINGRVVGTSAVGVGQFEEKTMVATLTWLANKGLIPKDWRHLKFNADLQDKMVVGLAKMNNTDPNKVEDWGSHQQRFVQNTWESYTGRNDRYSQLKNNINDSLGTIASSPSRAPANTNIDPNTGATKTQSDFGSWLSSLSFGSPLTYRQGWARSGEQREALAPSLHQQVIRPDRKGVPSSTSPIKTVDDALKGITNHITNVFHAKGQNRPVSLDSTSSIPSPSADTTTLDYKLYFHVQ